MPDALDKFDLKILAALQHNGRLTNKALAERIGLSTSPCWERVRRLEERGFIDGYHADINYRLVVEFEFYLVQIVLASHTAADFSRFETAIVNRPQVVACDALGGSIDYLMRVVARNTAAYQRFIDSLLESESGIERYFTYVVTKQVKSEAQTDFSALLLGLNQDTPGNLE